MTHEKLCNHQIIPQIHDSSINDFQPLEHQKLQVTYGRRKLL